MLYGEMLLLQRPFCSLLNRKYEDELVSRSRKYTQVSVQMWRVHPREFRSRSSFAERQITSWINPPDA